MDVKRIVAMGIIFILIFSIPADTTYSYDESMNNANSLNGNGNFINRSNDGRTLYVGGNGPNNYTSIQDAINDAMPGDTIFVYDNSSPYYENLVIDKSIKLIGENRDTTIIDGMKKGDVIKIKADNVVIKNFTIRNGYKKGYIPNGININSSHNLIYNCNIFSNEFGISVAGNGYNVIENCYIYLNNYTGIAIYSSNNIISNCEIYQNEMGIKIGSNNTILGCKIYENNHGIWSGSNNTIKNCFIYDNEYGLEIFIAENNKVLNNCFQNDGVNVDGIKREHFTHYFENNTINGKPLFYLFNESDIKLEGKVGQIILAYCKNVVISDVKINNTDVGIEIIKCSNISIFNCVISENIEGIYLVEGDHIKISHNVLKSNKIGMAIALMNHTIISKNVISYNDIAFFIFLHKSKFNVVARNNFIRNRWNVRYFVDDPFNNPSYFNIFIRNYWNRWHLILPKPLLIFLLIPKGKFGMLVPWIKFDFLPRLFPHR